MSGDAFGVFDDISVLSYLISKYNFANLKIDFIHYDETESGTRLGLRNDDPIMLSVFNKAIQSVTKKEKEEVQSSWLTLLEEKTIVKKYFDWLLFIKIILPICALILIAYILIFFHNKRLQREVDVRTLDLKKSREQFRTLIDNAADAIFVHDLRGQIVIVNQQAAKTLGYSSKELLAMSVFDIEADFPDPKELIGFWKNLTPDNSFMFEGIHKRKDNTTFPVEIQIGLIEHRGQKTVQALVRDITKRKKLEQERVLLATAIDQANETVVMTDMEGVIQYVNPAFEQITGYNRNEAVGQNPRMLKSGKQSEEFYNELWQTITSGETWKGHFVNKRKDGSLYEEKASISPIVDSSGKIINFIAVKRDVTQEAELSRRLHQTQKMESIGTLAGGIAHDFNNILSAILGYTELVISDLPEESDKRKDLDQVLAAANRATDLVHQILTFSRKSDLQLISLRVQSIIRDSIKFLRPSIPTTIEIKQNIDPECGNVMADPTLIHQVVMNLCTNAYHAMRLSGGILSITLQSTRLSGKDLTDKINLKAGNYLKLEVSDTGTGIPEDVRHKIFEPYFTTKKKGEGTGLGLAVVHGIIKSIGGEISVNSQLGKGTIFHVYLPEVEATKPIQKELSKPLPVGDESILIIDDEESLLQMHKTIIESLGYSVTAITKSVDALSTFQNDPEKFDLVITDMTMPNQTGADLAKQMLAVRADLPIILCTGYSELINSEKAKAIGISKYVNKPIRKKDMAFIIRKVLDKK